MTTKPSLTREDAIKANIYVHSFLANAGEYNKSPHFRPENKDKVRGIVLRLLKDLHDPKQAKAIDFGCGTGFMIELMKDLFAEVHGIDITLDMMKQVDTSSGNVFLHECLAENTPFEDDTFTFATAYSFMDHLFDYQDFLKEVYRVLKPGGIFYTDLNPNRGFISAIAKVEETLGDASETISPVVHREVQGALHNGEYYKEQFGMDGDLLEAAEPIKSLDHGFVAREVLNIARSIGFADCRVEYEWFLGQAKVMHEQSFAEADTIERYLNSIMPLASPLFKYLRFILVK